MKDMLKKTNSKKHISKITSRKQKPRTKEATTFKRKKNSTRFANVNVTC